MNAIVIINPST